MYVLRIFSDMEYSQLSSEHFFSTEVAMRMFISDNWITYYTFHKEDDHSLLTYGYQS